MRGLIEHEGREIRIEVIRRCQQGSQYLLETTPPIPDVLPFADMSQAHDQQYFSDGMAEEVLNALAHVDGLKVASRTSSFQFRNSDVSLPMIGSKLGVHHVLEGSVRKSGDTVRITAQLIDATTDQQLWSQTFDRPLTTANLFAIQDEIARTIVTRLTDTIVRAPSLAKPDTANLAAYDLYLKGRARFVGRSSSEDITASLDALQASVAKDPQFARAWETLAAVLVVSEFWLNTTDDAQQAALSAADKALALDPDLSLAWAVRGEAQFNLILAGKSTWNASQESLARAIDRDNHNATAMNWRGGNFMALGLMDEAIQDYQRCLAVDPAYELCRRFVAQASLTLGRKDEALRLYDTGVTKSVVTNADGFFARTALAHGDRAGARAMIERQFREVPQLIEPIFRAISDPTFSRRDREQALALVDKNSKADYALYAIWLLRDYDALATMRTDNPAVMWATDDPEWLHSPARKKMMQRWRLPEYWREHGYPPRCQALGRDDFECD